MEGLIACEFSGTVRDAFGEVGRSFVSCDLLDSEANGKHYTGNVMDIIRLPWPFTGAHPPCTFLCNSGVRWLYNKDGGKNLDRWIQLERAVNFFNKIKKNISKGYLENPIPHKYARDGFKSVVTGEWVEGIGNYTQVIQPWQFGHGEQKATCLWLINLPKLKPTKIVKGREQKIWKEPPSKDRWKKRSLTYPGIAKAMADQWHNLITP